MDQEAKKTNRIFDLFVAWVPLHVASRKMGPTTCCKQKNGSHYLLQAEKMYAYPLEVFKSPAKTCSCWQKSQAGQLSL
jgi:hypothetical protein